MALLMQGTHGFFRCRFRFRKGTAGILGELAAVRHKIRGHPCWTLDFRKRSTALAMANSFGKTSG